MAKGQKRSNREIKKPKQVKATPKPDDPFAKQMKQGTSLNTTRGKGRKS